MADFVPPLLDGTKKTSKWQKFKNKTNFCTGLFSPRIRMMNKKKKLWLSLATLACISLFLHQFKECLERYISHDTSVHLELKRFVVQNFI